MIYRCTKCLNLSTRPNTSLEKGGICEPCNYALENENPPFNILLENFWTHVARITKGKRKSELKFVLGVSGGKDSLRQAEFCRHTLGIEPTLVSVGYPPSMTSLVGVQNLNNLFKKNYEIYNAFPAVKTYKKLAKDCFFNLGNLKVAMEIALFNGAARMADLADADIVLWGENPAYSVGDENSGTGDYLDGSGIYKINTLSLIDKISQDIRVSNSFFYDIADGVKRIAPKLVFYGWCYA